MLAIDIPISLLAGLALSEAGKNMLKEDDPDKYRFMRTTVIFFAVFFITPIPFYFFMGWPAWETNFLWRWPDNIHDSPLRAFVSFAIFIFTIGPTYLGFELGRFCIRKGKDVLVRVGYISMGVLIGIVVFLTRNITFNIASTYAKYEAKDFYSFFTFSFFLGWLIVTVYFWGSLFLCYLWIKKKAEA